MTFQRDDLFNGRNPRLVMIAMTTDKAQDGDYQKNPFNFHHFNLSEIALLVGNHSVPVPRYQPDFAAGHSLSLQLLKFHGSIEIL